MKKQLTCIFISTILLLSACSGGSEENAIKVMSLNVRYDNPGDSINSWDRRAGLVFDFVKEEQPDILGLQEVLLNQFQALDSVLTDYVSVGVGRDDGAKGGEMNPVFFRKERFDMVRTITLWLSETPEIPGSVSWESSLPRIVTWMELVDKLNHEHFFFFNTHFAHDSDSARLMSSKLLLNELDLISDGYPFIITGDFNMLSISTGYSILTGPNESVPLIKDAYVISEKRPSGPISTFNGFSGQADRGRIDYILVRNGMKVLDYKAFVKKEKDIYISDHWPIMATVLLKAE